MASPWDDVRSESTEEAARSRASPLPWMLLTVSIALTVGVLWASRQRLEDERARTAAALKANDELKARLKTAETELERVRTGGRTPEPDAEGPKK